MGRKKAIKRTKMDAETETEESSFSPQTPNTGNQTYITSFYKGTEKDSCEFENLITQVTERMREVFKTELEKLTGRLFDIEEEKKELSKQLETEKKKANELERRCNELELKNSQIAKKQNDLEQYSRRESIRIFGLAAEESEDCEEKVLNILKSKMGVNIESRQIVACHRAGKIVPGKPRSVIVKFHQRKDRDRVFSQKKKLKGSNISISEDLTLTNQKSLALARAHKSVESTYTINGKLFAVLSGGRRIQIEATQDVNEQIDLSQLANKTKNNQEPMAASTPKPGSSKQQAK